MECELSNCFERAVARIPVLGVPRFVCSLHAGSTSEPTPIERYSLGEVVEIIRTLERVEHYPGTDEYDVALSDYRHAESIVPVTFARAMEVVMSDPPVRVGPETRDIEKPF